MKYVCDEDRNYIENKYHKTSQPFDPFKRMQYHGYEYDQNTGLDDHGIRVGLEKLFEKERGKDHFVIKAKGFAFVLDNMRIDVSKNDYFPGFYTWNRPLNFMLNTWKDEVYSKYPEYNSRVKLFNKSGAVAMWADFDHVIPNWQALMELGFTGLRQRALDYKARHEKNKTLDEHKAAIFEAIDIEFLAILRIIGRLKEYALAHPCEKTGQVAQSLSNLENGAPKTFLDALMAIYIYFMMCESVDGYQTRSLGNGLDRTLYPFYENDIESGNFTKDQLCSFLAYFLMQYSAIGNYWGHPFYLGGTDFDGKTRVNELTYTILDVYDSLDIYNPKIQIKISKSTPPPLVNKALDMIRKHRGSIVFCCEEGYMKALRSYGVSEKDAYDFEISGCYESRALSDESSTAVAYVNAVKPVMLALYNGFDTVVGTQLGMKTGDVCEFKTFDDFHRAFLTQWQALILESIKISNELYDPHLALINPSIMYTATIENALKKGVDGYSVGCTYNNTCILNCGFASAVDSMMAVKYLVYDQGLVTLEQLRSALEANWQGHEKLRAKALLCPHKYANDDAQADEYAKELAKFFANTVNAQKNGRGGVCKAIMHSARQYIIQGELTGATPDGRLAKSELSKNASPSVGMDKRGVTALINAALMLDPASYRESFCVDIMLHPSAVAGEDGLSAMRALLDTYMSGGGMAIQFNVFDAGMLRDAREHPEKYKNLQVRVCGWNVLWNNLSKAEQEAYIKRAENYS